MIGWGLGELSLGLFGPAASLGYRVLPSAEKLNPLISRTANEVIPGTVKVVKCPYVSKRSPFH